MVLYFTSEVVTPSYDIYMGEDKYENEDLIKYAWPEDVWFHVDKVSSAHVYIRLPQGLGIESIPQEVITDCCQLVKANSIAGNKMPSVGIVYTMASNLKKTGDMDVGQVSFHKPKLVRKCMIEGRCNEIVNRLNKTKSERKPDLFAELEERNRQEREEVKAQQRVERKADEDAERLRKAEKEERSYDRLFKEDKMTSNADCAIDEDDFM